MYCVLASGHSFSDRHTFSPITKMRTGGSSSMPLSMPFSLRSFQRSCSPSEVHRGVGAEVDGTRGGHADGPVEPGPHQQLAQPARVGRSCLLSTIPCTA